MRRKHQKGFTLLELIVVVAILSALASIAIPQYFSYRASAERASMVSDCRSLYRAFVIFYLDHLEHPYATSAHPFLLDKETFHPLTDPSLMEGLPVDIDIEGFRDKLDGRKAEKFDSPDDLGANQEFYIVLPWVKDPSIKYIVAASDTITYQDGTVVDGGNWLDGVFITKNGVIIGP